MAAYAALLSFTHIIDNLQSHPRPPIAIDKAQTQSLTQKIAFLQDFLGSYNFHGGSEELESLQSRIVDAAHAAEDVIESHIVDQICAPISARKRLQKLIKDMDFIKREVMKIIEEKVDIAEQTHNHPCPPIALEEKQVESVKIASSVGEETSCFERLRELIKKGMDFIKRKVMETSCFERLQSHNHHCPPIAPDKKKAESEKITILRDFVKYCDSHEHEVQLLLNRIVADNSIESETVDQIVVENIGMLHTLSGAYNSHRDKGLQTCIAENNISYHISHLIRDLSIVTRGDGKTDSSVDFYQRLQQVIEDMDLIEREANEIRNKLGLEDRLRITAKATVVSSRSPFKGHNIMVGFDEVLYQILDKLTGQRFDRQIIPIVGMGGIGKTTLARNVYASALVEQHFDISSWVTISQEYNVEDVISEILSPKNKLNMSTSSGTKEEDLGLRLHKHLSGKRYLIILDDMWSANVWDELKKFFPENNCGSRIIVTTRLSNLALELSGTRGLEMSFLNEGSSWTLLNKTVFGEEGCPHDGLEEIGKKIAGNCKGLPLSIVVIGGLLAKHTDEPAYWEYVAGNLSSFVNLEDDEHCYKTLHTSYDLLPTHLKPCFLYMGIYPEDHEISVSELIKLWVDEGFLKPINGKSLEVAAQEYLTDLIDRNLVLVRRLGTSCGKVKSCILHDLLRDLCLKEAQKEKFLCIKNQNGLKYGLNPEGISTQRRFAIHERASTDVQNFKKAAFQFASLTRSFIFDFDGGFPSFSSRLLRVLKVVDTGNFTEVREEGSQYGQFYPVFDDYVNLRHLAIVLPEYLFNISISFPSSVYHLWNLQTLIVIGSPRCPAAAPLEIWKMPLLKNVKLPNLYLSDSLGSGIDGEGDDFVLWNLQTLSTVCNFKFRDGVAERIPNIKKLKLRYEVIEHEQGFKVVPLYFLNNLGRLHKLESFGYYIYDYIPSRSDLLQNLIFPHSLRKLSLRGTWLNWEDMSTIIGRLPLLEVLKLNQRSFTGTGWETVEGQFCNLRFLLIDHAYDLKSWITEHTHFPRLEHLVLRGLVYLEEIPLCFGEISTLQSMKLESCSDGAVNSAKAIQEAQEDCGNESFKVEVVSWTKKQYEVSKGLATPNFRVEAYETTIRKVQI